MLDSASLFAYTQATWMYVSFPDTASVFGLTLLVPVVLSCSKSLNTPIQLENDVHSLRISTTRPIHILRSSPRRLPNYNVAYGRGLHLVVNEFESAANFFLALQDTLLESIRPAAQHAGWAYLICSARQSIRCSRTGLNQVRLSDSNPQYGLG